ncbi:MAG: hypothetical protein KC646_00090 [Candidatus Cloacimonetes bacterium]|nr:hypothetical protein [Candidatus Cloacimonadota bacterium]
MKVILVFILFCFFYSSSFCSLDKVERILTQANSLIETKKYSEALSILESSLKKNEVNFTYNKLVIRLRNKIALVYLLSDNDDPAMELLQKNMDYLLQHPQIVDSRLWSYYLDICDQFYKRKYVLSAQKIYQWVFQVMTKIKQDEIRFVTSYDEQVLRWSQLAVARSHVDLGQLDKAWQIISVMNTYDDPLYQYVKGRILFSWSPKLDKKAAYVLLKKSALNGFGESIYFLAFQFSNQIKKNPQATFYWYKILSHFLRDDVRLKRIGLSTLSERGLIKECRKQLQRAEELLSSKFLKVAYQNSRSSFEKIKVQIEANNLSYVDKSDTETPKSAKQLIECFEKQKLLKGSLSLYSLESGKKIIVKSYVDQIELIDKRYIKNLFYDNNKDRYRSDQRDNLWCTTHGPFEKKCDPSIDSDPNCQLSLELQKATLSHLANSPIIKKYFYRLDSTQCHDAQAIAMNALSDYNSRFSMKMKFNGTKIALDTLVKKKLLGNIPKHPETAFHKMLKSDRHGNIWCEEHGPYRQNCNQQAPRCVGSLFKYTEIMSLKGE